MGAAAEAIPQCFLQWGAQCALAGPSLSSEALLFLSKNNSKPSECLEPRNGLSPTWSTVKERRNDSDDQAQHTLSPASTRVLISKSMKTRTKTAISTPMFSNLLIYNSSRVISIVYN